MDLSNVKILVCDDSILARKQLKDIISEIGEGATFVEAQNGQEAIDVYNAELPNIAFLDIVMPVKDGTAAVEGICADHKDADIIIVSSVGTQAQLKTAIEKGAKDFVQKPIEKAQIERVLASRFGGK